MLRLTGRDLTVNCSGMKRRSFLQAGFLGLAGLSMADLLRIQAAQAATGTTKKNTACILVWLDGGPPQHETYDPKPEAPADYKGAYNAIDTSVPGLRLCELMTEQAKMAHRMAFIRSVHHDNGDHFAGAHAMLTGRWGATGADTTPRAPSAGSYVAAVRGSNRPGLPAYVGLQNLHSVGVAPGYHGANWLGARYNPFLADDTSGGKRIGTPGLFKQSSDQIRLAKRRGLLETVDTMRRTFEHEASVNSTDHFTQLAMHTLLSYTLLARRLVERGVTFVTVNMDGWDMHDNIAVVVKDPAKAMDRAIGSLVRDLDERGMLDHVMVVVMGEFGRTPKLNTTGVVGQTGLPGRDHWGQVMSVAMAGGGLRMGQAVGASNANGEYPADRPYTPQDVLATMYHVLGVNPHAEFLDRQARPMPVLTEGAAIPELV
ncbi:MAG: hypothetical protein K0Q72_5234 [Armatimonadetes bacterium]|nr:hypothetical protein [Armatimonadota bacterium]